MDKAIARGPISVCRSAGGRSGPKIRKSRAGPWRAAVLITLNLLMIAHIVQWLIMGRTVSPIEPSEFRFMGCSRRSSP